MKIGVISLGCSKNLVDTEIMLSIIKNAGHKIVNSNDRAEVIIINTCAFIEQAREEAIDNIIKAAQLKNRGCLKYIIATGCMAQRYGKELLEEMPELDGILGISYFNAIDQAIDDISKGEKVLWISSPPPQYTEKGERVLTTPPGTAYLKIAEGCSNCCSYCAIPLIKGKNRSRPIEEIVDEAGRLAIKGIKELVIIAQDTAAYGVDLYNEQRLHELLSRISVVEGIEWIRLMYLHPEHLSEKIINTIAEEPKIIPYLDIPIQHISDKILRAMNRRHDSRYIKDIIRKVRRIEDIVLRTTVMVGFPGEEADDFERLYDFVADTGFDWLGAFIYAREEGTSAWFMENRVDEETGHSRFNRIMKLQAGITRRKNIARLDSSPKILVSSRRSANMYIGRGTFQAPEVDGLTIIKSKKPLNKGEFARVVLKGVRNYDLIGEVIDEHS